MEWRKVEGFSRYEVSDEGGIIRKANTGKIMAQWDNGNGYLYSTLTDDEGKSRKMRVNRMVAMAFCDGRTAERNQVNHKDEKRKNNDASNLEWVTGRENMIYSQGRKVICVETNVSYRSISDACRAVNTVSSNICRACQTGGKAMGYHWRYLEEV